jgi:hypothetical protein
MKLRTIDSGRCDHCRRENSEAAFETVQLAAELLGKGVVGIDLSGARGRKLLNTAALYCNIVQAVFSRRRRHCCALHWAASC